MEADVCAGLNSMPCPRFLIRNAEMPPAFQPCLAVLSLLTVLPFCTSVADFLPSITLWRLQTTQRQSVGAVVGGTVGLRVGLSVLGCELGFSVGSCVGSEVGSDVGSDVAGGGVDGVGSAVEVT